LHSRIISTMRDSRRTTPGERRYERDMDANMADLP
jgi:hypothetical protein